MPSLELSAAYTIEQNRAMCKKDSVTNRTAVSVLRGHNEWHVAGRDGMLPKSLAAITTASPEIVPRITSHLLRQAFPHSGQCFGG